MIELIVPWAPGCPDRARALDWVRARYEAAGRTVTLAPAPAGPWCKAAAVAPAVAASAADIVVIADADCFTDGLQVAIDAVEAGAGWAIPHRLVHRLDRAATAMVLAGADWRGRGLDQRPYCGVAGGGMVVSRRDAVRDIPLDPRFIGWGQEDESWACALECLLGEPWRGTADLVHLWHPPQPRADRRRGNPDGWQLRRRYFRARHDPNAMRDLIGEAHAALDAAQPALHDRPPARLGL